MITYINSTSIIFNSDLSGSVLCGGTRTLHIYQVWQVNKGGEVTIRFLNNSPDKEKLGRQMSPDCSAQFIWYNCIDSGPATAEWPSRFPSTGCLSEQVIFIVITPKLSLKLTPLFLICYHKKTLHFPIITSADAHMGVVNPSTHTQPICDPCLLGDRPLWTLNT